MNALCASALSSILVNRVRSAVRNDLRNGDAESMSVRATREHITDADYTTAGFSLMPSLLISFLYLGAYRRLGCTFSNKSNDRLVFNAISCVLRSVS